MAQMDMSAALTNPYTLSTFGVTRRVEVVNGLGESVLTATVLPAQYGVIYPLGPAVTDRQPGMQVTPKTIQIVTLFALVPESETSATSTSYQPDIVTWHGNSYIVKALDDYSDFAAGFNLATCVLVDSVSEPPSTFEAETVANNV